MSFTTRQENKFTVIKFSAQKLDAVLAPDLKTELVIISKNGAKNIILDLESVKYCDSSGLSALLIGHRVCKVSKGLFILSGLQANLKKLITISQLGAVFTIKNTNAEAIDFIQETIQ
jgi:anti-anti-sigma factor